MTNQASEQGGDGFQVSLDELESEFSPLVGSGRGTKFKLMVVPLEEITTLLGRDKTYTRQQRQSDYKSVLVSTSWSVLYWKLVPSLQLIFPSWVSVPRFLKGAFSSVPHGIVVENAKDDPGKVPDTVLCLVTQRVSYSVTPRTAAHQASLSKGFSRQEYWIGLPCSPPGDLPNPGIEP